jgi:hypothetical protein
MNTFSSLTLCSRRRISISLANIFQSYCEIWKLEVNVNKTKVVVLSKGKIRLKYEFKLQTKTLDIVAKSLSCKSIGIH